MKTVTEPPAHRAGKSNPPAAAPPRGFQRWFPWAITAFFALWIIGNLRSPKETTPFHVREFGELPVVLEGRVQPIDSVARNTLLIMRSKQTLAVEPEGQMSEMARMFKTKRMPATEWLLEVMTRPDQADERKLFRIDNLELKSLLKLSPEEKHFSFTQVLQERDAMVKEAQRVRNIEEANRTAFEKAVARLNYALSIYLALKNSLQPEHADDFAAEVEHFNQAIPAGLAALKKSQAGESFDQDDLSVLVKSFQRFQTLEQMAYPLLIPPANPANKDGWANIGASLNQAMRSGSISPAALAYAKMGTAYAKDQPDKFNAALAEYQGFLKNDFAKQVTKGQREAFFNRFEFFIKSLTVYLVGFLLACAYWIGMNPAFRVAGVRLAILALIVHTIGVCFRMYLEGRPPVTNLYSSALFVGWGAVVLCLILERFFKNAIALLVATFAGFVTLVIAHNLSLDGDTMKLLQAVLDTNIWLATHVVVITLGYSSMFVAGLLGMLYVILGVFTRNLSREVATSLNRMVYGIVCFATLFSFVGTVLGGIWADQSWGRFWGWDPKENGALLIVIWCAVILHARWGGMIRERGLMAMVIFGNIVTAFSWFGVNMLGVGLHSYGFMDEAFKWLMGFIGSQIILIGLTLLPPGAWKSNPTGAAKAARVKASEGKEAEELAAARKAVPESGA